MCCFIGNSVIIISLSSLLIQAEYTKVSVVFLWLRNITFLLFVLSIGTAAQEYMQTCKCAHVRTPLLANALLMINDHNENVHRSLSCSQVLHGDKHDKNKGCPFLGSIFSLLSAGLFTSSPQERPIFGSLAEFHTKNFSL